MRWLPFVLVQACFIEIGDDDGPGDGFERVVLADVGTACVYSEATDRPVPRDADTFAADASVDVAVWLDECASGCASVEEASCDVARVGGALEVTARAVLREPTGPVDCPAVCVEVLAVCRSVPLPAGAYTVTYGGGEAALDVPSTAATPCATAR